PRHAGPLGDPNEWARVLALFAPLTLAVWASERAGWRRSVWLVAFIVIAVAIYLTQSRGGFLALALSVAIFFVLARKQHRRLALGAPVLVVAWLVVAPGGGERLGTLREASEAAEQGGDESLVGRFVMGLVALAVFADHPAIGVGTGNFDLVSPDYQRRM